MANNTTVQKLCPFCGGCGMIDDGDGGMGCEACLGEGWERHLCDGCGERVLPNNMATADVCRRCHGIGHASPLALELAEVGS